jgi:FkbM family methyltransferase
MVTSKKMRRWRRAAYEWIGMPRHSRPGLNGLDRKLETYLNCSNGFFIEAGANDGFTQSNTYYLERMKGWRGILIEGIPELYAECIKNRRNSKVFNCALVPFEYPHATVEMVHCNLMSFVKGALGSHQADEKHLAKGRDAQPSAPVYRVTVPARTLTSVLEECCVRQIDFFSLDVEGFELEVLQGLDLKRYRPNYLCVEARFRQSIMDLLAPFYTVEAQIGPLDVLFKAKT